MAEGLQEGSWEEQKRNLDKNPDFHMDTSKEVDPVERLVEQLGWEGALERVQENLDKNPNDEEARRQANLMVNLMNKKMQGLRDKLSH
ncbi:hypothetical protein HY972_00985 [Candidatus Kaiserbacteria bacterium]|nr:hypothetical protein [Candidatus Kaiserbacteria bacterium]